ncbi:unnamed protein product, partial [Iphiclides podalirius]
MRTRDNAVGRVSSSVAHAQRRQTTVFRTCSDSSFARVSATVCSPRHGVVLIRPGITRRLRPTRCRVCPESVTAEDHSAHCWKPESAWERSL